MDPRRMRPPRAPVALWVLLPALLAAGCMNLTVTSVRSGTAVRGERLERLEEGVSTLSDVLEELGAPLEVHGHPEGRLLVYRCRVRNTFGFSVDAGGAALSFLDLSQVVSTLLGLLHFTVNTVHRDEDRLAILLDRDGVVQGIGYHAGLCSLSWY